MQHVLIISKGLGLCEKLNYIKLFYLMSIFNEYSCFYNSFEF